MAEPTAQETQAPTPSTQTNKLIELCMAVLAGEKGKLNDLNLYLQERMLGLDQARTGFLEQVQAEGPEFQQQFGEGVEAVLNAMEAVALAQVEIAQFLKDRQTIHLERGVPQLIDATNNMFAAVATYESRYAQTGPTNFPILNFFHRALEALRQGEMQASDFRFSTEGARKFFGKCLEEIDASSVKDAKGVPERRDACISIVAALEELEANCDGEVEKVDAAMVLLEDGFIKLDASLRMFAQGQFADGPTESPPVNWVIHAAEGVKAGQYAPTLLKEALDWLEKTVRQARAQFEQSAQVPVSSSVLQDEIPRTLEAFDLHDEAIALMRRSLPNPTAEQLEAGIQALTSAVGSLKKSVDTYQKVSEREGKVVCPRCEELNLPASKVCNRCGGPLPQMAVPEYSAGASSTFEVREDAPQSDEAGAGEMVMTTHLKRIFDACEAIDQGQITPEEFTSILDWAEDLLDQGELQISQVPRPSVPSDLPEEEQEAVQEQLHLVDETGELLTQGLADFRAGLESMRSYLERQSRDALVQGIRTVWEASQRIYQVQRMGETAEQMAAQSEESPEEA